MSRRLTGFTPSGELHLGNYVGAIRPIVAEQAIADTVVFVSDLHALTLDHQPDDVRRRTLEFATLLLAAGADPDACLFMVQSHVPEHSELHYLLECATGYGEAQRMIQFKEKSRREEQVRVSLLTYPILMASDILLDDTDVLRRKVMRAVTDAGGEVAYDPARKPGVSNLLAILAACTGQEPGELSGEFGRYGDLKHAVADAVVATLEPVRDRYQELSRDPDHIRSVLRAGAARASELGREKVRQAKAAIGLLPA